ncbi:hypothetical protein [Streptomyces achromogenes]|uniref:hypothetical protein n=1 Tax=Streptomyces achromogenes TaxID=67255 RepID=UPI0036828B32
MSGRLRAHQGRRGGAGARRGLLLLPGPSVRLGLTAVENLADACLTAAGRPPGACNIPGPAPYDRDEAIRTVLRAHGVRARIGHVPLPAARAAAGAVQALARLRPHTEPPLTRYAVLGDHTPTPASRRGSRAQAHIPVSP